MNLTELTELMHERYEAGDVPVLAVSRLDGVRRKVARYRRRRTVTAFVAAALLVGGVSSVAGRDTAPRLPRVPTTSASVVHIPGILDWNVDGPVVAGGTARMPGGTVRLTIVPAALDINLEERCTPDADSYRLQMDIELTVNGQVTSRGICGIQPFPAPELWPRYGIRLGVPLTIAMTVTNVRVIGAGNTPPQPMAVPPGTIAFAVRQWVPFTEYPARPSGLLPSFDASALGGGMDLGVLSSVPGNPAASSSGLTLTWPKAATTGPWLHWEASSQTPGALYIMVNGHVAGRAEFYGYYNPTVGNTWGGDLSAMSTDLRVQPGQQVTITVTPAYVTGAWAVGFRREPTH